MYKRILVPVEHSDADHTIVDHVSGLAKLMDATLVLLHVADGWAARHFDDLQLRESEEMRSDREYLEQLRRQIDAAGIKVEARLAMGDPASEIVKAAHAEHVDLVAMSTHGHRFVGDLLFGATADRVRHEVTVPVLLLRVHR